MDKSVVLYHLYESYDSAICYFFTFLSPFLIKKGKVNRLKLLNEAKGALRKTFYLIIQMIYFHSYRTGFSQSLNISTVFECTIALF